MAQRGSQIDRHGLAALWSWGIAWAMVGCGPNNGNLILVTGKVTVDNELLRTGSVSFRPDTEKGNTSQHHPTGDITAEGAYELFTAGQRGAPPGHYKVLVFARESPRHGPGVQPAGQPVVPRSLVNAKYGDVKTTDVKIEVVPNAPPGTYNLKLSK